MYVPAFKEALAWATLRAIAVRSEMPCSAAAMVLAVGALTTKHPTSVAACRSTLSMPTPALPTTCTMQESHNSLNKKTTALFLKKLSTCKINHHQLTRIITMPHSQKSFSKRKKEVNHCKKKYFYSKVLENQDSHPKSFNSKKDLQKGLLWYPVCDSHVWLEENSCK
jgi:hypothetical protein